jgi:hypothetical protein
LTYAHTCRSIGSEIPIQPQPPTRAAMPWLEAARTSVRGKATAADSQP